MDRKTVAVIAGGRTPEHEISLRSGYELLESVPGSRYALELVAIDSEGSWSVADPARHLTGFDYVLPLVHGGHGAGLHGMLSMLDVPLLGESAGGSTVALDKPLAKRLLRQSGLPVLPDVLFTRAQLAIEPHLVCERVDREIGFPCFVKPASGVASAGATPVYEPSMLMPALVRAAAFDSRVLVEKWIDAREIEVGVLGGELSRSGELVFRADFHDHASKRDAEKLELAVPALVDGTVEQEITTLARNAFAALELEAVGRVEIFLDRNDHSLWVNEVNALPSFHRAAAFRRLWEASGVSAEGILDRLVASADARMQELFRTQWTVQA